MAYLKRKSVRGGMVKRLSIGILSAALALFLVLAGWVRWGNWPQPGPVGDLTKPTLIIVLGGGDGIRVLAALRVAERFPDLPLVVTGDSGFIQTTMRNAGLPPDRLEIEPAATSTWENALFTKPWIEAAEDGPVLLVTNDFHAPRAAATFRAVFPGRDFQVAYEATEPPFNQWQQTSRRRERAAALYYLLRYGIWSW